MPPHFFMRYYILVIDITWATFTRRARDDCRHVDTLPRHTAYYRRPYSIGQVATEERYAEVRTVSRSFTESS